MAHLGQALRLGTFDTLSICTRWLAEANISIRSHGPLADSHPLFPHPPTFEWGFHAREQIQQNSGPSQTVQQKRILLWLLLKSSWWHEGQLATSMCCLVQRSVSTCSISSMPRPTVWARRRSCSASATCDLVASVYSTNLP